MAKATFGSGCFWCSEAIFQQLKGIYVVTSGYAGGHLANPSYEEVCSGKTGHAEVVQMEYAPSIISYKELLEVFWKTHDPTTLSRQGDDIGTQYRSAVFYHNEEQKELAKTYKKKLDEANVWTNPIVTEITPISKFYPAENHHTNYFHRNEKQPYCSFVIAPKVKKFQEVFSDILKNHS